VPGKHSGGDVQSVSEVGDLVCTTITIGVFKDLDGIAAVLDPRALLVRPALLVCSIRVFDGGGDPEAAFAIEGEIDGLVDLGLSSKELDLKTRRNVQRGALSLRREGFGLTNQPVPRLLSLAGKEG